MLKAATPQGQIEIRNLVVGSIVNPKEAILGRLRCLRWAWMVALWSCLPFPGITTALAQDGSALAVGEFESQTDVGQPSKAGSAVYDPGKQEYRVAGSGANMWFGRDEFHFVWKRLDGDFLLRARARFLGRGVEPHRKLGWMIRSSLSPDSKHVNAVVHGDGLTSFQFRRANGSTTEELKSSLTGADVIQLERRAGRYAMSVARFGQPLVALHLDDLDMGDRVYAGLFVCSHNTNVIEEAVFRDVRIVVPAKENFVPYKDYLGSRLETLDVETGERRILYRTPAAIEAPNWTRDGRALIYNSRGKLFRFPIADGKPMEIDTGTTDRCNNDHVLSFDGRTLGISHHPAGAGGGSVISTMPLGGGEPKRVTSRSPSYLHGWSPDGNFLVYTGQRDGEFDIYKTSAEGGEEIRLTRAPGLDDGPEFSPDGSFIYFNSTRSGTMQIWRMKPDGSQPEQLTHDDYNNWFPHVSPDGRQLVFLSFSKDVAPDDHPYYRQVYLRRMPVGGGPPRVVAYVYGGQGTLNVPSWSPDNRHLAFVSNSAKE